jgi:hypothetical protein
MWFGEVTDELLAVSGVMPMSLEDFVSRNHPMLAASA